MVLIKKFRLMLNIIKRTFLSVSSIIYNQEKLPYKYMVKYDKRVKYNYLGG